jgi:hypothetical protein
MAPSCNRVVSPRSYAAILLTLSLLFFAFFGVFVASIVVESVELIIAASLIEVALIVAICYAVIILTSNEKTLPRDEKGGIKREWL